MQKKLRRICFLQLFKIAYLIQKLKKLPKSYSLRKTQKPMK